MRLIVLDLDDSVTRQAPVQALIDAGPSRIIDLSDLAARLRLVASPAARKTLQSRLGVIGSSEGQAPDLHLLGSGDFHHLTYALLEGVEQPMTVVVFDNHPDWSRTPSWLTCGTWINWALALNHIERVITIGPCSGDLQWPEIKGANLDAMRVGRLEVYP